MEIVKVLHGFLKLSISFPIPSTFLALSSSWNK